MKRRMIQCATAVNRDAVRRESIGGIEHVVVSSFTLPDNIVMNGLLYPADEIEAGFASLERTLAPVEHPTDSDGNFISASDPVAIHNFHAGAFNVNVTRDNGRVHIEKFINVQEALKSDRGRRLMDRINELETSDDPRSVHTSVGVFIDLDETAGEMDGQEYSAIARGMVFDHDAILLDSVGAAQPGQGVGLAVNNGSDDLQVDRIVLNAEDIAPQHASNEDAKQPRDMRSNQDGMSITDLYEAVREGMDRGAIRYDWIEELFSDSVIFTSGDEFYTVPYTVDETTNRVTIVGIPLTVERNVTFTPKVNSEEGDAMKDLMLKALADAGMTVNADISDADLLAQYNALQANQSEGDGDDAGNDNAADLAEVVASALKPVTEELAGLKAQMNAQSDADVAKMAELVGNSD